MIKNFIPTINISSIIKKNQDKKKIYLTIKKIEKACIDVGFFQIIGHGIDPVSYTHLTLPTTPYE